MNSIHIRQVDPATLVALKRLARVHHHSLQGELRAILDSAAQLAPAEDAEQLNLVTVKTGHSATWGTEEIYGSCVG